MSDQKKPSPAQKPLTSRPVPKNSTEGQSKALVKPKQIMLLPLVAIREGIMFPQTEAVLNFGRKKSVTAIQHSQQTGSKVVLVAQKNADVEDPQPSDLYTVGTLASIERTLVTQNQVNALVMGIRRVKILRVITERDYFLAEVEVVEDFYIDRAKIHALSKHLSKLFNEAVNLGKAVEFLNFMKLMSGVHAGELADQIASTLQITTPEKQAILEILDVQKRLEKVIKELSKEIHEYQIERDIINQTQQTFDKHMKESVLRERLRTIKKELGELDDEEEEIDELAVKVNKAKLPKEVAKKVNRELKRLERMSVNNPETGYIRSWIEAIVELPWNKRSKNSLSLQKAEEILNKNHYGLKEVKERILEHLAILRLKSKAEKEADRQLPTILCFVGAPGVGKTSIGKSIAEAMGRKFIKVSLGGIRDEAEIRGHRRTYVGAMPGRIISGMSDAKTKNPVFMLDEIDKVGLDYRGDPSAALLEALDPEQNASFSDHYLEVPFDLSEVLFITTANTLDTIPPALRDRLEIIRYSGYTEEEKFRIAKDHLINRILKQNGLSRKNVTFTDESIYFCIRHYSREAGVRELERQLSKVVRKTARFIAEEAKYVKKITPQVVEKYLGPKKYEHTLAEEKDEIGLATGMAWTSVGGDVLFIEVSLTKGKGRVILTGKLGDVMKESAQAALTYVKSQASKLGIPQKIIDQTDVHVHVPEGATPKDGPSAGITIATAIVSAFKNTPVKREIAMTGEVTLRGRVLEIGGLKEKVIAAHRAGCQDIIAPASNKKDLVEIPDTIQKDLRFHFVKEVNEVLQLALKKPLAAS